MSKPIVFFDIDGTILNHDKQIPKSTKRQFLSSKIEMYM
ncbi:hydroxymethylpyrimidine pyrophosphatase-like HAD family hydrolase [Bacillus sp. OAE603]